MFLHNASPEYDLGNIKMVNLPSNITSVLQHLDLEIIRRKLKFYWQQSQHILAVWVVQNILIPVTTG